MSEEQAHGAVTGHGAADSEIAILAEENALLRAALDVIAHMDDHCEEAPRIAREALDGGK